MNQQIMKLLHKVLLLLAVVVLVTAVAVPAYAQWKPTKPVEVIVPAGAGGASDQMARVIQGIIVKYKYMDQPLLILNKGGASGAEGIMDTKDSKGNAHKLMVAFSAIFTLPEAVNLPFNWRDLNPVAMIAQDVFLLWVNSESPYKTTQDYLKAVKAAPPSTFKMGGTGSKREDHIITLAIDKAAGTKFVYIPYKSGGEAATQLVGKHTDSNVNNPSENFAQWRANQVRALCVLSDHKMAYKKKVAQNLSWSEIPTCKSQGLDVTYQMLRAFFLPSGTTAEQVAYYTNVLKKVVATKEWKDYCEQNALATMFVTGKDFTDFLAKDEAFHQKLMKESGLSMKK